MKFFPASLSKMEVYYKTTSVAHGAWILPQLQPTIMCAIDEGSVSGSKKIEIDHQL